MGADSELDVVILRLHRQAEKMIEESGIPFTFLRPNDFMQNFVNFYSSTIRSNNALYLPAEDARVSFIDVRDIAATAVKALTDNGKHIGKAYTITGPEALSYSRAAEILSNVTCKKISYVNVSEEDTRKGMKSKGWDDWIINATLQFFDIYRKGYSSRVSSEVQEILGRRPISFTQFAKDYTQAFR